MGSCMLELGDTGRPLLIMGCRVFPLQIFLLIFLLPLSTAVREFPSAGNEFILSGFSHTDTNHVDTQYSIDGLDDLPPPHTEPNQQDTTGLSPQKPAQKGPNTISRNSPRYPSQFFPQNTFPQIQHSPASQNHPASGFGLPFDPFNNFFNIPHFQPGRKFPNFIYPPPSPLPSPNTTPRTTPSTTPRPKTFPMLTTERSHQENVPPRNLKHEFNDNHIEGVNVDYPQDDSDTSTCPGSLRECLTACSPIINIYQVAYKLCVNECLERYS